LGKVKRAQQVLLEIAKKKLILGIRRGELCPAYGLQNMFLCQQQNKIS
jgi:hypothetical protein